MVVVVDDDVVTVPVEADQEAEALADGLSSAHMFDGV